MKLKPERCSFCNCPNPGDDHWKWEKDSRYIHGGKWRCREYVRAAGRRYMAKLRADPERKSLADSKIKEHYAKNPEYLRYKAYKYSDARKGLPGEAVSWERAKPIMFAPCTYCAVSRSGGLDRIDNTLGHTEGNVVACCATCNLVLLDMPVQLKHEFIPSLVSARQKGLFTTWQHPRMR